MRGAGTGGDKAPSISKLNPSSFKASQQIEISGSGFQADGSSVKFGEESAKAVVWQSATKIKATAPDNIRSGQVTVTVTTPHGTATAKGTLT